MNASAAVVAVAGASVAIVEAFVAEAGTVGAFEGESAVGLEDAFVAAAGSYDAAVGLVASKTSVVTRIDVELPLGP